MGAPYNEDRYSRVVAACALEQDLATLPDGDATEIGEKGVTLSGVLPPSLHGSCLIQTAILA
jgi:ABC-type multidrug transport system fused ATPase/permease subunit